MAQIRAGIEKRQPVIGLPYAVYTVYTVYAVYAVYADVFQLFVSGSLVKQCGFFQYGIDCFYHIPAAVVVAVLEY